MDGSQFENTILNTVRDLSIWVPVEPGGASQSVTCGVEVRLTL